MTDIKLKCCPFCGSDGVMITTDDEYFWVRCTSCDSEQGSGGSEVEAAKAWNSRSEQTNQLEIAKLEQALKLNDEEIANSEAIKTSIAALTDARISDQQQEINKFLELSASLNSQAVLQVELHNKVVVENNELRAMVEQLRGGLGFYADCGHYKISDGRDVMIMDCGEKAEEAISKTPKQCLSEAKAQAIKDAIANSEKVEFEGSHYVGTYVSLEDLEVNIKQLGE